MTDAERLLEQATRCCAVLYIDARNRIAQLDSQDETDFWITATVHELVRQYRHLPIGECDACGSRAPLKTGKHEGLRAYVCAWEEGCL